MLYAFNNIPDAHMYCCVNLSCFPKHNFCSHRLAVEKFEVEFNRIFYPENKDPDHGMQANVEKLTRFCRRTNRSVPSMRKTPIGKMYRCRVRLVIGFREKKIRKHKRTHHRFFKKLNFFLKGSRYIPIGPGLPYKRSDSETVRPGMRRNYTFSS